MQGKSLRIAWLGPAPGGYSGVRGVGAELLLGLGRLGHHIDCFLPAAEDQADVHIAGDEQVTFGEGNLAFGANVRFIWGTNRWKWNRWYSRTKVSAFASGMLARTTASFRLRSEIARRHREQPYDVVFQFNTIETPALPARVARVVPLVIQPETHAAGELRWLIAERRLSLKCQPPYVFPVVAAIMAVRAATQRRAIRRARLVICISTVFRDHLVRDYGLSVQRTVVVPNPVRTERFSLADHRDTHPPTVLVLGRISTRKGIDDVVALTQRLLAENVDVRVRVAGDATLWSDYTALLDELPAANAEYIGHLPAADVPVELARSEVLLAPSKFEPFGLTIAEALAAGVPVVATSEVGAIEGVDRSVVVEVAPGDVEGMINGITNMLQALRERGPELRRKANAEATRLFAPEVVCAQVSAALQQVARDGAAGA